MRKRRDLEKERVVNSTDAVHGFGEMRTQSLPLSLAKRIALVTLIRAGWMGVWSGFQSELDERNLLGNNNKSFRRFCRKGEQRKEMTTTGIYDLVGKFVVAFKRGSTIAYSPHVI